MNTTRPAVLAAIDTTAEDIANSKNWTGYTLRQLFEFGRVSDSDIAEWTQLRTDEAIDRAYTRILEHPERKKPYLMMETECLPLYRWADAMQNEVLELLKNEG